MTVGTGIYGAGGGHPKAHWSTHPLFQLGFQVFKALALLLQLHIFFEECFVFPLSSCFSQLTSIIVEIKHVSSMTKNAGVSVSLCVCECSQQSRSAAVDSGAISSFSGLALLFLGLTNAFGKVQANNTIKAFCITFFGYKKIVIFFGKQNYVGHGSFYQRRVI